MAKYAYHRLDNNQKDIRRALEQAGYQVIPIGRPVDLLVGKAGRNWLLEVKTEIGYLRDKQAEFIDTWTGQVAVVRTVEGALAAVMI